MKNRKKFSYAIKIKDGKEVYSILENGNEIMLIKAELVEQTKKKLAIGMNS